MTPLNLYLEHADDAQRAHAMREYGNAIKELARVNIFAGDLLFKNFGVTRFGRVVFYDYDEIEYLTDCNFRGIPPRAAGLGRDVGRGLVSGRTARRVPRGIRDVPAHRPEDARVLPLFPRRSARRPNGGRRCSARSRPAGSSRCCRIPTPCDSHLHRAADAPSAAKCIDRRTGGALVRDNDATTTAVRRPPATDLPGRPPTLGSCVDTACDARLFGRDTIQHKT